MYSCHNSAQIFEVISLPMYVYTDVFYVCIVLFLTPFLQCAVDTYTLKSIIISPIIISDSSKVFIGHFHS